MEEPTRCEEDGSCGHPLVKGLVVCRCCHDVYAEACVHAARREGKEIAIVAIQAEFGLSDAEEKELRRILGL